MKKAAQTSARNGIVDAILSSVEDTVGIEMADRGAPTWVRVTAYCISTVSGACIVAAVSMVVLSLGIIQQGAFPRAAQSLLVIALVPALLLVAVELLGRFVLTGYRHVRREARRSAWGVLGAVVLVAFLAVHPGVGGVAASAAAIGTALLFARSRGRLEPLWRFRPEEATALLVGRDGRGRDLATLDVRRIDGADVLVWGIAIGGTLACVAVAATAVADGRLVPSSLVAIAILGLWALHAVLSLAETAFAGDPHHEESAYVQGAIKSSDTGETGAERAMGLRVDGLTVDGPDGRLLDDISLKFEPGEIIGLVGASGAGKSVMMQALCDPWALRGCVVSGTATYAGIDLWARETRSRGAPVAHLPPSPLLLQGNGLQNLCCFQDVAHRAQAERCLQSLVFSGDAVARIMGQSDARRLSHTDAKALAFARAFLVAPSLYLVDRPEDYTSERLRHALRDRLSLESRAGRTVVLVTEDRQLQGLCTRLVSIEDGRVVDCAPAKEMQGRISTGWSRFVGERRLETEESLVAWVRAQFKRDGDEENRRRACRVAAEALALSCQSASGGDPGTASFDFKHFEGVAVLRLTDIAPLVTSGAMQEATRIAAEETSAARRSPLARILADVQTLEQDEVAGKRVLTLKIETYDPRKRAAAPARTGRQDAAR
ncbi:MAG: ATP-binding cassette domain-containing protein [Shimia sp.]